MLQLNHVYTVKILNCRVPSVHIITREDAFQSCVSLLLTNNLQLFRFNDEPCVVFFIFLIKKNVNLTWSW